MKAALISALAAVLAQYAPKGIKWLIDGFVARVSAYLDAHPNATAKLEQVAAAANGDGTALAAVGAPAPAALKEFLQTLFDQIGSKITRPAVHAAYNLVASFVVNVLADELYNKLFPAAGHTAAAVHTSDVSAWQHSVLAAAHHAGRFDTPHGPTMPATAAAVPTVNDPPPAGDEVPPIDPAAPTL